MISTALVVTDKVQVLSAVRAYSRWLYSVIHKTSVTVSYDLQIIVTKQLLNNKDSDKQTYCFIFFKRLKNFHK